MRNIILILITGIFTIGIMGCANHQRVLIPEIKPPTDWSKTDPIAFLEILKNHPDSVMAFAPLGKGPPRDWIKEEHIAKLMELIDSQEPAAPIHQFSSSEYPFYGSTVGTEAMYLIEGFRIRGYPHGFCSGLAHFRPDPDEYRKWWNERKKRNIRK